MQMHSLVDQTTLQDGMDPAVLRLEAAARKLTLDPAIAEGEHVDLELVALVDECLHACRDGVLLQALNCLRHESAAHDLLKAQIETASASAFVHTGEGARVARLCAIPVLLSSEQRLEHGRLAPGAAFDTLTASLRNARFMPSEATVVLGDYLYHPNELHSLWPSEIYRLPASLLAREQGSEATGPPTGLAALARHGWPSHQSTAGGSLGVQLRYLLVTIIEELGADDLLKPRSEDEKERLQVDLCDWTDHAGSPLAGALGLSVDEVMVLSFAPYAEALRTGFESLRYVQLRSALGPLVDHKVRARALSVTLELFGDGGEECSDEDATGIRLLATSSLRHDGALKTARSLEHHYPITGKADAEESLERVVSVLRNAGVRRIWVVKHPHIAAQLRLQPSTAPVTEGWLSLTMATRPPGGASALMAA